MIVRWPSVTLLRYHIPCSPVKMKSKQLYCTWQITPHWITVHTQGKGVHVMYSSNNLLRIQDWCKYNFGQNIKLLPLLIHTEQYWNVTAPFCLSDPRNVMLTVTFLFDIAYVALHCGELCTGTSLENTYQACKCQNTECTIYCSCRIQSYYCTV